MSFVYGLLSFCVLTVNVTTLDQPSCEGVLFRAPVVPVEIGYKVTPHGAWLPIGFRWGKPEA